MIKTSDNNNKLIEVEDEELDYDLDLEYYANDDI
jgi:hypothetical protein